MMKLKSLIILFKAHQSLVNNVKESLKGTDLNINEFTAMEALYEKGELTTQELIDLVLIPNSSMTYVLEIMSKKGYLEKRKKESDKRIQMLTLSKNGRDFFEEIYQKHFDHMRTIFDVLTLEEEEMLQGLLKKIGKKAEAVLK